MLLEYFRVGRGHFKWRSLLWALARPQQYLCHLYVDEKPQQNAHLLTASIQTCLLLFTLLSTIKDTALLAGAADIAFPQC